MARADVPTYAWVVSRWARTGEGIHGLTFDAKKEVEVGRERRSRKDLVELIKAGEVSMRVTFLMDESLVKLAHYANRLCPEDRSVTEAGTYETASTTPKRRTTAACLLTASGGACVAGGVDLGPIYGTASATPPFSSP